MIWIVQQQQISNPRMSHIKISVVLLIVTLALGQTGEQAQGHAQPNAEVVQKTEQQINAQPIAVQPVVVQPVPVEPHLPNIINPQPVGQGGTDIPLPQPIPVQPILSDPATQPQAQAQQHVQPQPVNNEQPAQPVQTQQHQQQPQVIHIQHNTQQQQTQHTQAQQTQQTHETQQQAQQVHQTQQGNQTPQGTQQQTQQGAGYRPNVAAQQHQGNHAGNRNRPNYDNPDAQRSAKYKAQQERLNQIRRKQRQLQEKRAQEMGVGPNPHIQIDRKINQNQLVRNQQRQKLHNLLQQQLQSGIAFPKKTVMFQVDKQIEQYVITPTTEIMITLRILIYVLENNAYGFVKDIDKSKSLKVFVYEDNARIAAQTQFYFESAVKFLAKPKSTYIVRFYNQGVLKLVSLTYPNMLQAMQMQNLYSKQKGLQQITKTQMISMRIEQVTQRLRRNSLLDRVNNDTMMGFLRKYSGYQFVEMLIVIIISAFQVHLVKNMFQTDSIL